jgi:hypothetical protein
MEVSMPAFVAHFLIANDLFATSGLPKESHKYFLLGSVGPDLPYYRNVFGSAVGEFFEARYNVDSPGLYAGYGDYFHARTPNIFPMKMLETVRKDKDPDPVVRTQKLAYALGYLTHVAADQHVHPFVERYAGAYYLSGTNRKKHRTIEVYEDILLYEKKAGEDFFEEDFRSWFDISEQKEEQRETIGPTGNPQTETVFTRILTPVWFGPFIQRSFLESYGRIIDGDEAEKWVAGFTSVFRFLESVGPYHDAYHGIRSNSSEANEMEDWFSGKKMDYLSECFEPAEKIAAEYVSAGKGFFAASQIGKRERNAFSSAVLDADLTSPLVTV